MAHARRVVLLPQCALCDVDLYRYWVALATCTPGDRVPDDLPVPVVPAI